MNGLQKHRYFMRLQKLFYELLKGACFVAHNVHFDYTFLQEELELNHFPLLDCPVLDTVEMTRIFEPTMESLKLSDIASVAGFDHDRPHQADSDAYVTAEWFLHLLEKAVPFRKGRSINYVSFQKDYGQIYMKY